MKNLVIKILKTVLVFVISLTVIYFSFTTHEFFKWCDGAGIQPLKNGFESIDELDIDKINETGKGITNFAKLVEEDASSDYYKENPDVHSVTEYFDPVAYAVFSYLQGSMSGIVRQNVRISLFLSVAISVAYLIISNKKMNYMLKFIVGYLSVLIVIPPVYMYSWTGRFWSLKEMYFGGIPKLFYIIYTLIFIVMYVVNYKMNLKLAKDLNKAMKGE